MRVPLLHEPCAFSTHIDKSAGEAVNPVAAALTRLVFAVSESEKPKNRVLRRKWKNATKTTLIIAEDVATRKKHQIKHRRRGEVMSGSSFVSVCTYWEK